MKIHLFLKFVFIYTYSGFESGREIRLLLMISAHIDKTSGRDLEECVVMKPFLGRIRVGDGKNKIKFKKTLEQVS